MTHTFTYPLQKQLAWYKLYRELPGGKLEKSSGNMLNGRTITPDYPLEGSTYYSGGAGLSSTIEDYAIFLQMLLNGGIYNGKRVLGRNTVDMMITNQIGELPYGNQDKFGPGVLPYHR